jgi:glycosyltransferase involved in cell wall biosynthesis
MIQSVQTQTFADYEHIIVDDGSTDESAKLISTFASSDPRIKLIRQSNQGRSNARNNGVLASTGKYVCFLDSDDVWLPNHLQRLSDATTQLQGEAMLHSGLIWFYDDGAPEQKVSYTPRNVFTSDVEYVIANQFAPDCVCLTRAIAERFPFDPALFINEDVELWSRIASEYPVVEVKGHTAKLRVHSGNTDKEVSDNVTPKAEAFSKILSNPSVAMHLSSNFVRNRKRSLLELRIRHLERVGNRMELINAILIFVLKYPRTPGNAAKLVTLIYNLPGGSLLKHVIQSLKRPN